MAVEGIGQVVNVNVGGILYTTTLATLTKVNSIFIVVYLEFIYLDFLIFHNLV